MTWMWGNDTIQAMKRKYEFINHTADLGIKVWGESLSSLFENAAYSMFDIIGELDKVRERRLIRVQIRPEKLEELLADWLRNLLYQFNVEGYLLRKFRIERVDVKHGLKGEAKGEKLASPTRFLKTEIKAVTYHELKVKKTDRGWEAQVIFDV